MVVPLKPKFGGGTGPTSPIGNCAPAKASGPMQASKTAARLPVALSDKSAAIS
jgi:hypothetical protein